MGFTLTKYVTIFAVSSYLTFSPLPHMRRLFSVALSLRFPSLDVIQHHCSMEPGLSSCRTLRYLHATIQFTLFIILNFFCKKVNITAYLHFPLSFYTLREIIFYLYRRVNSVILLLIHMFCLLYTLYLVYILYHSINF